MWHFRRYLRRVNTLFERVKRVFGGLSHQSDVGGQGSQSQFSIGKATDETPVGVETRLAPGQYRTYLRLISIRNWL